MVFMEAFPHVHQLGWLGIQSDMHSQKHSVLALFSFQVIQPFQSLHHSAQRAFCQYTVEKIHQSNFELVSPRNQ
jgi:hypothetical protein